MTRDRAPRTVGAWAPALVESVLSGAAPYDALPASEQKVVRAEWAQRIAALREDLNLAREFSERGDSWSELDGHGRVVQRNRAEERGSASNC
jgi:hypothetical protein